MGWPGKYRMMPDGETGRVALEAHRPRAGAGLAGLQQGPPVCTSPGRATSAGLRLTHQLTG